MISTHNNNSITYIVWAIFFALANFAAAQDCSCSPLEYTFTLMLDQNCETDSLSGSPGIGLTFCFLGTTPAYPQEIDLGTTADQSDRRAQEQVIEITSVQFLEFDTTGDLIVINQDDTYADVSLVNGDKVTFKSISNDLDPSAPLDDQLDLLPGGVQLTLRGRVTDDVTEEEIIISNRVTWSYTNACGALPFESDSEIGWIEVDSTIPASQDFCPVAPSAQPSSQPSSKPSSEPSSQPSSGQGKAGKSGTKSSKSGDCTDCSADVLTRANTVTSLTYGTYANDGVINQQSLYDFCCNKEEREAYLQAIEFTSGCLAYTDCLIAKPFIALIPDPNATITEGGFLTAAVNTLCLAEQTGEKQPAVGGDECATPELLCIALEVENGPCSDERPGVDNN